MQLSWAQKICKKQFILYKNQAGQANPADNTTPPAGDANGADGQVYDADFKDVDSDKKDGENK